MLKIQGIFSNAEAGCRIIVNCGDVTVLTVMYTDQRRDGRPTTPVKDDRQTLLSRTTTS